MQKIQIEITDATYDPHFRNKKCADSEDERMQDYYAGLMDGVCGTASSGLCGDSDRQETYDYVRGVSDGTQIFRALMDNYRKEINCPLTTEIND